jgi:hypothetical protein
MNKIYYILIGVLVIMFVYMVTDDNCSLESFTQINEENKICNNKNALNYLDQDNENIDNSFCNYNSNVICHRPLALNYTNNIYNNNLRCPDLDSYNYEAEEFMTDEDKNKIPVKVSDLDELGKYCGIATDMDDANKIFKKNTTEQLYKVKKCASVDACKYIENKICKYPMANIQINSLKGITFGNAEFNNLILKEKIEQDKNGISKTVELENHELMPGNLLTAGPHLSVEGSKLRSNLKKLYIKLFNNDGTISKGEGLNIWDINGKVDILNLQSSGTIDSYIDNSGKIISRKGYSLSNIPRNYYELVYAMRENEYHVALSVNDSGTKYAVGIGKTKSEAADVALLRCITFISLNDILKLFKNQKDVLINILHNKLNLIHEQETKTSIWDTIKGTIGVGSKKIIINPLSSSELKKKSEDIRSLLIKYDTSLLGKKIIYLTSHRDVVNYNLLNIKDDQYKDIVCKVNGNHNGKICSSKPSLEELLNYIYLKSKKENKEDPCGLLMIDDNRYINIDLDASFIDKSSNCNLPNIMKLCPDDKNDCQEIAVIGYNKEQDKCTVYQDIKYSLYDEGYDYRKLPIIDESKKTWINERNDIMKNDKVNLTIENINKCKKSNNKCIVYKTNNEISSYNSLY